MTVTVVGAVLLLYLPELNFTHPTKQMGKLNLPFFKSGIIHFSKTTFPLFLTVDRAFGALVGGPDRHRCAATGAQFPAHRGVEQAGADLLGRIVAARGSAGLDP